MASIDTLRTYLGRGTRVDLRSEQAMTRLSKRSVLKALTQEALPNMGNFSDAPRHRHISRSIHTHNHYLKPDSPYGWSWNRSHTLYLWSKSVYPYKGSLRIHLAPTDVVVVRHHFVSVSGVDSPTLAGIPEVGVGRQSAVLTSTLSKLRYLVKSTTASKGCRYSQTKIRPVFGPVNHS